MDRWVHWSQTDPAGIVFYPNVFVWFDEAAEELFRALGLEWHKLFTDEGIHGIPIVEAHCQFFSPMPHGEQVKITVSVGDVSRKAFKLLYEVRRGETLCASGYVVRVFVDQEPSGKLRARPLPERFKQKLQSNGV
jgi:YbgC/YbaW family acyl-CoA thioester hydrolase